MYLKKKKIFAGWKSIIRSKRKRNIQTNKKSVLGLLSIANSSCPVFGWKFNFPILNFKVRISREECINLCDLRSGLFIYLNIYLTFFEEVNVMAKGVTWYMHASSMQKERKMVQKVEFLEFSPLNSS